MSTATPQEPSTAASQEPSTAASQEPSSAARRAPWRLDVGTALRAAWLLVAVVVVLGAAREAVVHLLGTGTPLGELRPLHVDEEASIPTWVSTVLLAVAALAWAAAAGYVGDRLRRSTLVVAIVLGLASMDEASSLHETLIEPLRDALDLGGALYFAWVVAALPLAVAAGIGVVVLARRLEPHVARPLLLGAAAFLVGALGLELVGGAIADGSGRDSVAWSIATVLEEGIELTGAVLLLTAGLRLLLDHTRAIRVTLTPE